MSTTPVALTLNAGSSSLKFGLYDIAAAPVEMAMGLIENIGKAPRLKVHFGPGRTPVSRDLAATDAADHRSALTTALAEVEWFPPTTEHCDSVHTYVGVDHVLRT